MKVIKNNKASNPNSQTGSPSIPDKNASKPMDSKQDVANSNDAKTDQDFPGYPHYPAKEDVMNEDTADHRVDADVENLPDVKDSTSMQQQNLAGQNRQDVKDAMTPGPATEDDLGLRRGSEADVTSDDLVALQSTDAEIGTPQNVDTDDLNTDLDIPGSELDDTLDAIGDGDEENNYYSLGGDRHESQEEDPQSGPVRDSY